MVVCRTQHVRDVADETTQQNTLVVQVGISHTPHELAIGWLTHTHMEISSLFAHARP